MTRMKLPKDRSNVINGGGSGDDASGRVLDRLKFVDGLEREIKTRPHRLWKNLV